MGQDQLLEEVMEPLITGTETLLTWYASFLILTFCTYGYSMYVKGFHRSYPYFCYSFRSCLWSSPKKKMRSAITSFFLCKTLGMYWCVEFMKYQCPSLLDKNIVLLSCVRLCFLLPQSRGPWHQLSLLFRNVLWWLIWKEKNHRQRFCSS